MREPPQKGFSCFITPHSCLRNSSALSASPPADTFWLVLVHCGLGHSRPVLCRVEALSLEQSSPLSAGFPLRKTQLLLWGEAAVHLQHHSSRVSLALKLCSPLCSGGGSNSFLTKVAILCSFCFWPTQRALCAAGSSAVALTIRHAI